MEGVGVMFLQPADRHRRSRTACDQSMPARAWRITLAASGETEGGVTER